jgi:hypothetical protein
MIHVNKVHLHAPLNGNLYVMVYGTLPNTLLTIGLYAYQWSAEIESMVEKPLGSLDEIDMTEKLLYIEALRSREEEYRDSC